jgi:hypothetical protein
MDNHELAEKIVGELSFRVVRFAGRVRDEQIEVVQSVLDRELPRQETVLRPCLYMDTRSSKNSEGYFHRLFEDEHGEQKAIIEDAHSGQLGYVAAFHVRFTDQADRKEAS